ncbi:hypothetical protein ACB092_12G117100 [Castanea dentata]
MEQTNNPAFGVSAYNPAAAPAYNYATARTSQDTDKMPTTFHMKKTLKLKQLKRRGKNKRKCSMPATEASVDAMVE